jgi:hypothetical protein
MNDEFERIWKETAVAYFNVASRHSPGETDENHETPHSGQPGVPAEIRTENILNIIPVQFLVSLGRVRLSPLGTSATTALLYQPRVIDIGDCGAVGGTKIGRGNPNYLEETCPSATLSTTNPT